MVELRWSDLRSAEWLRLCLWSVFSSTIFTCPMAYLVSRTLRCRQRRSPRHVRPGPRTRSRTPLPPINRRPSARMTRPALSTSAAQDLAQQNLIDGADLVEMMLVVRARGLFALLSGESWRKKSSTRRDDTTLGPVLDREWLAARGGCCILLSSQTTTTTSITSINRHSTEANN